jgi:hypothetical protein
MAANARHTVTGNQAAALYARTTSKQYLYLTPKAQVNIWAQELTETGATQQNRERGDSLGTLV